jgi:hypothetical protein
MKKIYLFFLVLTLVSTVAAASATFETDQTQQVNIGGEQVSLELIGVNEVNGEEGLYKATFLQGDLTATVIGWDYFEHGNRLPSRINGEYVGLMDWDGEDTTDDNTDDTATLAWGKSYFPCEEVETGENQYKFCGDETKTLNVNDEDIRLDFQYVRSDDEHSRLKHAAFLRGDMTLTLSDKDAPQYSHTYGEINGRTAYLTDTRGSNTERGEDDAVLVEIQSSELYDVEVKVGEKSGKTVELYTNAESSQGIDRIEWDLNGDNQYEKQGRNIEKTFDSSGEKTVSMKVDDGVQERKVSKTITIEEKTGDSVREINRITNFLGGNIDNIRPDTEIRFGNSLQNSLYIHEVSGEYSSRIEVEASAGSKNSEKFRLDQENLVDGVQKQFSSREYTVHLCGDSTPDQVTVAVSKKEGMQGYGACFNDEKKGLKEPAEYSSIDYSEGELVNISAGEKLVFGENLLFVDSLDYNSNIERYSMDAYANKLADNHEIPHVSGTSTQAYFYDGEYSVHFCNYHESTEEAEIAVSQRDVDECVNNREDQEGDDDNQDDENEGDQGSTVQRIELEGQAWNNIAVNIDSVSLNDDQGSCEFAPYSTGGVSGYAWTVEDAEWKALSRDQQLDSLNGYSVWARNDCTLTFEGTEAEPQYSRELYGDKWNLISLPPGIAPAQLKNSLESQGGRLYPWDGRLFWTNTGSSWIHPVESLNRDRPVYIYSNISTTVDLSEMEEGPGPGAE